MEAVSTDITLSTRDQTLVVFESGRDLEPITQQAIHSIVYMLKEKGILPFQTYSFTSYFRPFSRSLQEDIDDAVAFQYLEEQLRHSSMTQWVYSITEQGSRYVRPKIETIDKKQIENVQSFLKERVGRDLEVLLDEAYHSLNEQLAKRFSESSSR